MIRRFNNLIRLPWYLLLFGLLAFYIIDNVVFSFLQINLQEEEIEALSLPEMIFWGVIFAPLVESLLCQALPVQFILAFVRKTKIKYALAILISAILFGMIHCYSVAYVIHMFILGLGISIYFIILKIQRSGMFAYWMTVLAHFLMNSIALINNYFYA